MDRLWTKLLGALLVCALPATAQDPAPAQGAEDGEGAGFYESLDVTVVNVEIFVTDKRGTPVTGLTAADFELFEDGKPVQITNFYAVEGRRPVNVPPRPAPEPGLVPGLQVETGPEVPDEQQLNLIVYVDNFNLRPFNRNRVFRRLREFLQEQVTRQDRVMLISYDRSLHLRHPFTNDPTLVSRELLELEEVSAHGVHQDSERRDILRWIEESEEFSDAVWRVRTYAESTFNDLSFTIDALSEFVDSLAGLTGRKAILYVSDGLPMRPAEDMFYYLQQKFSQTSVLTEMQDYNAATRFQRLAAKANSNRVTFYTIDAAGLRVYTSATAEVATAGEAGISSFVDSVNISNLQSPLQMLAETTGGQAIINTNDVGPSLAKVAEDFSTYYSAGYVPSHGGDDRYHRIEVKLKDGKGLRVRHREGYRGKTTYERMADSTLSVLHYGYTSNPLEIALELGQMSRREDGHFLVPVRVLVPLGNLVMVPLADAHQARARLYFAARDEKGDESEVQEVELPITIPAARYVEAQGQHYTYEVSLLMRPGPHELAVGVRDELGANISFVKRVIQVGSG